MHYTLKRRDDTWVQIQGLRDPNWEWLQHHAGPEEGSTGDVELHVQATFQDPGLFYGGILAACDRYGADYKPKPEVEAVFEALYDECQTNDAIKSGDTFEFNGTRWLLDRAWLVEAPHEP